MLKCSVLPLQGEAPQFARVDAGLKLNMGGTTWD